MSCRVEGKRNKEQKGQPRNKVQEEAEGARFKVAGPTLK
jgi:hypothetical protein